ncbi:MAG: ABC transporter substrate-binding protein [Ignavibacteriae bacterium]|nr:ABC transporter substrate-binding protein [Ignavibacteriota bacterium]
MLTNKNILLLTLLMLLFSGCSRKESSVSDYDNAPVSLKVFDIPLGADSSVSPESGGKGFKGEGWETNNNYNSSANPGAVKGGNINISLPDFPVTLRPYGKDANNGFNAFTGKLFYETLLDKDPVTSEFVPSLATHWKVSDDKMTFYFRINPDARWADGKPVTSDDFIATWKLLIDKDILEPYLNELMSSYEEPVADSKYIFSIKSKNADWRLFDAIATDIKILPSHYINNLSGKGYLEKYQYSFIPGSGPYALLDKDIVKGQSLKIRRITDYWGEKLKFNTGKNNFNVINFIFLNDELLKLEKLKKGEIDVLRVNRASEWNTAYNFDKIKRGIILKKRVFNEYPAGISGICINTKIKPFDDARVRKALAYAFDRKKLNEKLFDNAYTLMNSYFPGSVYENSSNPHIGCNLDSSAMLLSSAGWTEKNQDGYLVKNGKVFETDIIYNHGEDIYLTIFQEDLKKVGIKLNLTKLDGAASTQAGNEKGFSLITAAWSGSQIPNPENMYGSKLADLKNNANWSGINDKKIDELCVSYNNTFNFNDRISIVRNIDSLLCEYVGYILTWYAPYHRIVFQNKFGYPESILDRETGMESLLHLWYIAPDKSEMYNKAVKDESIFLEPGETDSRYWQQNKEKK